MGSEASGIVMGHAKQHSHVWKSEKRVGFIVQNIKTPFFSSDRKGKPEFLGAIIGTQAQIYIGPWALSEEAQWSESRSIVRKT